MSLFRRSRAARDRDRAEELAQHMALAVDELVARGVPAGEARRQVRLRFGNPRVKQEEVDDMNRLPILDVLSHDVRYALRVLRRTPAFTLTALLTLALVIGGNAAVFSLADAILLKPLPYPNPGHLAQLVVSQQSKSRGASTEDSFDGTTWELVRDQAPLVDIAATAGGLGRAVNLVVGSEARAVTQARVSAGYFRVLGVAPIRGREFTSDEDRRGGPAVAIISHALWQRVFAADPNVIGRSLLLRGEPHVVVGVMGESFVGPDAPADVWTPLRPSRTGEGGGNNYGIVARVKDGHSWKDAIAAMPPLDPDYFKRLTGSDQPEMTATLSLVPLQDYLTAGVGESIWLLGAAAVVVLIIACVNLAALLLARGVSRHKEVATRMALGGGRAAIVRQLLVESLVLGLAGGALGIGVAYLDLAGLKTLGGATFEAWTRAALDVRSIGAGAALAVLASAICGLVPALQASRVTLTAALSDGGSRSIAGASRHWVRRTLVVSEVALGVVLLVIAGLFVRTYADLRALPPGFDPSHVVTTSVSLQDARYKTAAQMNALFNDTLRRLRETPGIESAAVSLELPYTRLLNMGCRLIDRAPTDSENCTANVMYVTPGFFDTLRIPIRRGRAVRDTDIAATAPVIVVNQGFQRLLTGGTDAMGRRIRVAGVEREVVGIAGDVQVVSSGLHLDGMMRGPLTSGPLIYLPAAQTPDSFMGMHIWFSPAWVVRASHEGEAKAALQRAIREADPLLPVGSMQGMSDIRGRATARQQLLMVLVAALGASALVLAAIGLYGLIAQAVSERTREVGIRIALGATSGQTIRSIAGTGIGLAILGALVGVGGAWMAVQLVESLLWGVTAHDPATFVGAPLFLMVVAAGASVLPALRLLRLDPARTLRE